MTMLTLILINEVLGGAVVYGVLLLLAYGIRSDRRPTRNVHSLPKARRDTHRIAA